MAQTSLKKFNSSEREIVLLQDNVDKALNQMQRHLLFDGIFMQNIVLAAGANTIEHKLGRKIKGAIYLNPSAVSDFYDNLSSADDLTLNFTLNSSAVCTVNLWVF